MARITRSMLALLKSRYTFEFQPPTRLLLSWGLRRLTLQNVPTALTPSRSATTLE